jgi:hypothetical protein
LVSDIPTRDGKIGNLFNSVPVGTAHAVEPQQLVGSALLLPAEHSNHSKSGSIEKDERTTHLLVLMYLYLLVLVYLLLYILDMHSPPSLEDSEWISGGQDQTPGIDVLQNTHMPWNTW